MGDWGSPEPASAGTSATVGRDAPVAAAGIARARALTPAELAWVALAPCALAMLAAIVVLGPPLGHALFKPGSDGLWPPTWWEAQGRPEPVKHGRYVLAALAPLLLAAVVLVGARRAPRLRPQAIRALTLASQGLLLAFVVFAELGQRNVILVERPLPPVFGIGTLVAAAALVLAGLAALRRSDVGERLARIVRETPRRRAAGLAIAVAFAATWLLEAVTTDRLIEDRGLMNWTLNDVVAILDGRTPLVDYHIIYSKLLPYPTALVLAVFGTTALAYTIVMTVLSVLALLAVYAVLRRVVRSSPLALGLFLPFVALSDVGNTMIMPSMWPMRYGGAYLLAWLTGRHVDGRGPRRAWVLFLVGGLVAIDDLEFGTAAFLATAVALLCARPPRSARAVVRLGGSMAGGALGAVVAVSVLTYVRAGALPDPALLTEWPRIFTNLGWYSLPMPTAGLQLVLYATFVAAIAVTAVRVVRAEPEVLLTSMLGWSGIFGVVAGSYYVGRSDDVKLVSMFSAWGLALALLTIVCVRELAARGWRRPGLAQLLVLFGFGIAICSLGRISLPQTQIARLTGPAPHQTYRALAEQFVRARTHRGQTVAIMLPESYRIAYDLVVKNIAPYGMQNAIVTRGQMQILIDALQRAHVDEVFLPVPLRTEGSVAPEQLAMLAAAGFPVRSSAPEFIELRRV